MATPALNIIPRSLDAIDADLSALDAILFELGGDITEDEAAAAIDRWFEELGSERDEKLHGYAWRIRMMEANAKLKREEEVRLAAARKRDETSVDWLKRRLLMFVQDRGSQIKGKETRQVETPLHRFVETMNGGKRALTLLVQPLNLPAELREDTIGVSVMAGHDEVFEAVRDAVKPFGVNVVVDRTAHALEAALRAALETAEAARMEREADFATSISLGLTPDEAALENPVRPDEDVFLYARLEPRGTRLEIR